MKYTIAALVILLGLNVAGQSTQDFSKATRHEPSASLTGAYWQIPFAGKRILLQENGSGTFMAGHRTRHFSMKLSAGDLLSGSLYYAKVGKDLILLCEAQAGDAGYGFITRLDGRELRVRWKSRIDGFNVGPGLIEDMSAYVTAIGFIGKVDLSTGAFQWKHAGFYRKYDPSGAFNIFVRPRLAGRYHVQRGRCRRSGL